VTDTGRLIWTASRSWTDPVLMWEVAGECLEWARSQGKALVIVHGDAPGGDQIAKLFGEIIPGCQHEPHPADWEGPCRDDPRCKPGHRRKDRAGRDYCPMAGIYRNEDKLIGPGGDRCAAFIKARSRGASNCAALAEKAGIPTRRYEV
jgi:hypothetical protein